MSDHDTITDPVLDQRIRATLHRVAVAAVPSVSVSDRAAAPSPAPRRRLMAAGALALAAVSLVAFTYVLGPEHVDKLPPDNAFITGTVEDPSGTYWIVPSFHKDVCGRLFPGVEVIVDNLNTVGQEWNTAGLSYGDQVPSSQNPDCSEVREEAWLADPSRAAFAGFGEQVSFGAVHPTVTRVRITPPGGTPFTVPTFPRPDNPTGPRYLAWPRPWDRSAITLITETAREIPYSPS